MAKIYFDLVQRGLWEIGNVPVKWLDKVQSMIDAQ